MDIVCELRKMRDEQMENKEFLRAKYGNIISKHLTDYQTYRQYQMKSNIVEQDCFSVEQKVIISQNALTANKMKLDALNKNIGRML